MRLVFYNDIHGYFTRFGGFVTLSVRYSGFRYSEVQLYQSTAPKERQGRLRIDLSCHPGQFPASVQTTGILKTGGDFNSQSDLSYMCIRCTRALQLGLAINLWGTQSCQPLILKLIGFQYYSRFFPMHYAYFLPYS